MQITAAEQVTIAGVTYDVIDSQTPDEVEARYPNIARHMRKNGQIRQVYLKRPAGRVMYFAVQFNRGDYSTVTSAGHWS